MVINVTNISGVYKLYWNNCDYYYIGQSIQILKRYKKHLYKLSKNIHENKKLQNIYNIYGSPFIVVLEGCKKDSLDITEQKFLDLYFSDKNCCNICQIASSTKGYKHTKESLKKISEKSKLKIFTEEYKQKLRGRVGNKTMLGKTHTIEAKEKISKTHKNKPKTKEHKKKIGEAHKGEKHYNFGKQLSIETKNKLSVLLSKGNNPRAIRVININTGKIYDCLKDASEDLKINYSTMKSNFRRNKNYFIQKYYEN